MHVDVKNILDHIGKVVTSKHVLILYALDTDLMPVNLLLVQAGMATMLTTNGITTTGALTVLAVLTILF